jgi:hypothetical protein
MGAECRQLRLPGEAAAAEAVEEHDELTLARLSPREAVALAVHRPGHGPSMTERLVVSTSMSTALTNDRLSVVMPAWG